MKASRLSVFILLLPAIISVFSIQAYASLQNRGTDSLGYQLIYDSDLDITWYDRTSVGGSWQTVVDWADTLSIYFGGTVYSDWRLPETIDGTYVYGYDGTTTGGFNITSSEMGHLYHTELGNLSLYDTSGNNVGAGNFGINSTGPFKELKRVPYWSGTEYSAEPTHAWDFDLATGFQYINVKDQVGLAYSGLAVRDGDVALVPEPINSTLFIVGGSILGFRRLRQKKHL